MNNQKKIIDDLLFNNECFTVTGLSMKVHNNLGKGFKEVVYKDALEIEFKNNNIPFERENPLKFHTKGQYFLTVL